MTHGHAFWFLCTWACVAWYSVVTLYVAVRGVLDIREMLHHLKEREPAAETGLSPAESKEES